MKKLLLLFTACLMYSAGAQVVFCPPGAVWKSIHTRGYPDSSLETETITCTGKQFISPDTVQVLTHERFFMDVNAVPTRTTYIKQKGDTIFMKNERTQNSWQILYNFAAQPNDTWINTIDKHYGMITYSITVISTQTVNVQGYILKQLTLYQKHNHYSPRNNFSYKVTERLGSELFLFTFGGMAVSDGDYLIENLCYTDNTFGTYQYSEKTCDYTTLLGLNDPGNLSELAVYPNPTQNELKVKGIVNGLSQCNFQITNMLGETLQEGNMTLAGETRINTQDLPGGLYFLKIRENSRELLSRRFIKTN